MLELISFILLTLAPISELRGSIPIGLGLGLSPWLVIPLAYVLNCLVFFPIYFGLELLWDRFFSQFNWAQKLMGRAHRRGSKYVEKYQTLGLAIFVAIPLPVTGVWTGTAIAWLLKLDWKKSFLAICLGVLIAATIISAMSLGVLTALSLNGS